MVVDVDDWMLMTVGFSVVLCSVWLPCLRFDLVIFSPSFPPCCIVCYMDIMLQALVSLLLSQVVHTGVRVSLSHSLMDVFPWGVTTLLVSELTFVKYQMNVTILVLFV